MQQHWSSSVSLYEGIYTDIDIDDINPDITQNYHQSLVKYNVRDNNEWNEEVPSRFNSNVETTDLVARDHSTYDIEYNSHRRNPSYRDTDEDQCCCIIL
jgi:hypothetical protein